MHRHLHSYSSGRGPDELKQLEQNAPDADIRELIRLFQLQTPHLKAIAKWKSKAHEYRVPFESDRFRGSEALPQYRAPVWNTDGKPVEMDALLVRQANEKLLETRQAIKRLTEILQERAKRK